MHDETVVPSDVAKSFRYTSNLANINNLASLCLSSLGNVDIDLQMIYQANFIERHPILRIGCRSIAVCCKTDISTSEISMDTGLE